MQLSEFETVMHDNSPSVVIHTIHWQVSLKVYAVLRLWSGASSVFALHSLSSAKGGATYSGIYTNVLLNQVNNTSAMAAF